MLQDLSISRCQHTFGENENVASAGILQLIKAMELQLPDPSDSSEIIKAALQNKDAYFGSQQNEYRTKPIPRADGDSALV